MAKKASGNGRVRRARPGDNLQARAAPFLQRIEARLEALETKHAEYMAACKGEREKIKELYVEAKTEAGLPVKALKGLVSYRALARKQERIKAGFDDIDEAATYETLVETLGELGAAAARAAGHPPKDDNRDLRGRGQRQREADRAASEPQERPDEAELARLGRGHPVDDAPPTQP